MCFSAFKYVLMHLNSRVLIARLEALEVDLYASSTMGTQRMVGLKYKLIATKNLTDLWSIKIVLRVQVFWEISIAFQ